jgi:hypothetical protein
MGTYAAAPLTAEQKADRYDAILRLFRERQAAHQALVDAVAEHWTRSEDDPLPAAVQAAIEARNLADDAWAAFLNDLAFWCQLADEAGDATAACERADDAARAAAGEVL